MEKYHYKTDNEITIIEFAKARFKKIKDMVSIILGGLFKKYGYGNFRYLFLHLPYKEVDLTIYTPACMAKTSDTKTFNEKEAWVYGEFTKRNIPINVTETGLGWGKTSQTGSSSKVLVEKMLNVVKNKDCNLALNDFGQNHHICANSSAVELKEDLCLVSRSLVFMFLRQQIFNDRKTMGVL